MYMFMKPHCFCILTTCLNISSTGSWVELEELIAAVSRRESLTGPQDSISSALQGELERILLEAQLECERSKDRWWHCQKSLSSPTAVFPWYNVIVCWFVCSPPQVTTPQSTSSPKSTSEHDSDCVPIQVLFHSFYPQLGFQACYCQETTSLILY